MILCNKTTLEVIWKETEHNVSSLLLFHLHNTGIITGTVVLISGTHNSCISTIFKTDELPSVSIYNFNKLFLIKKTNP